MSDSKNRCNNVLAVTIEKTKDKGGSDFAKQILSLQALDLFNIIILFDKEIDLEDNSLMLWKLFNNVDPGRDLIFGNNHVVIDACKKGQMDGHTREWPDEMNFDD